MRLAYLSGAPRVSTAENAVAGGPRAHVLGVVGAFERAGWVVDRYIAGDRRWARSIARGGFDAAVEKRRWRSAVADAVRFAVAPVNSVLAQRAVQGRPDLAYERFGSYQRLGRQFQRSGTPWVLETSGPFFLEAKIDRGTLAFDALARSIELGAYRKCDLLVCVSDALRELLVRHGVDAERAFVLPNAVDTARFDPTPHPVPVADHLTIGFVGSVLDWQGLDRLVRAVATARGRDVPVVAEIVGDGPAIPALRELARELGVERAVRFRGRLAPRHVPAAIAGFDVGYVGHVATSTGLMYHSPLKLYEYGAMGVPALAVRHDETARFIEEARHGYLFCDDDNLTVVIERAAGELVDLRKCRSTLRAHVVEYHSWDHRVADLLAELRRRGLLCA